MLYTKLRCIWLLAQSGKTRKCIEEIKKKNEEELFSEIYNKNDETRLDIYICSNNTTLVDQTGTRMVNNLYTHKTQVFNWLSKNKEKVSEMTIFNNILNSEIKMLVCCTNKVRMEKIKELLENLSRNKMFNKKVSIWIDEADATVTLWKRHMDWYENLSVIDTITLVSATYRSVLKKFGDLPVIQYGKTKPDTYVGICDSEFVECNMSAKTALEYIKKVIDEKELLKTTSIGYRLFAPADISVDSHNCTKQYFLEHNWAVAILNGKEKAIYLPNNESPIDISNIKDQEIGQTIAKFYNKEIKNKYNFVITGNMCLNRGITLQTEDFIFNSSIIFHMSNPDTLYQCAARTSGNIRNFRDYPHVMYCHKKTRESLLCTENIAASVANGEEGTVRNINEKYVKDNSTQKKRELTAVRDNGILNSNIWEEFKVENGDDKIVWANVERFYQEKMGKKIHGRSRPKKNQDGFYECSTTAKVKVCDVAEIEGLKQHSWDSTFQLVKGQLKYARIFVGYSDRNDNTKYVIYVKNVQLKDCSEVKQALDKYGKSKKTEVNTLI